MFALVVAAEMPEKGLTRDLTSSKDVIFTRASAERSDPHRRSRRRNGSARPVAAQAGTAVGRVFAARTARTAVSTLG